MIESLRKEIRQIMNDLADDIATGAASDFGEYQRLVGKIEGIAVCERLIIDVAEKLRLSDDAD